MQIDGSRTHSWCLKCGHSSWLDRHEPRKRSAEWAVVSSCAQEFRCGSSVPVIECRRSMATLTEARMIRTPEGGAGEFGWFCIVRFAEFVREQGSRTPDEESLWRQPSRSVWTQHPDLAEIRPPHQAVQCWVCIVRFAKFVRRKCGIASEVGRRESIRPQNSLGLPPKCSVRFAKNRLSGIGTGGVKTWDRDDIEVNSGWQGGRFGARVSFSIPPKT